MNEAISYSNEKSLMIHKNECIQLSIKNNWPHLEALVYFFLHSFFVSQNKTKEAHEVIDKAIQKADQSVEQNIVESEGIRYQYRIAKGNLFFMNKKYVEAGDMFKQCLQLKRTNIDKHVLLGIYQMLGNSIKKSHSRKEAWNYFEEGWQLLKNENLDALKNNTIIMFYAKDMIETASGYQVNLKEYSDMMDEWWGKNWLHKLKQNQHNQFINETAP
jgi:tetratricopeptide (TPR) repeat protein